MVVAMKDDPLAGKIHEAGNKPDACPTCQIAA
jgi:hypothetical protein